MSIRTTSFAFASALALAAPAAVAAPTAPTIHRVDCAQQSAPQTRPQAPAPAPSTDADRYAGRETRDRDVSNYEGGSTFVITMSGTTLVLIVVLLLIL